MHAMFRSSDIPCPKPAEQRAGSRAEVALPILIDVGRTRYSALLHNISTSGAMVETRAPLFMHSKIEIHCGSIRTAGYVLRQAGSLFGIKFGQPISEQQLSEQVSRSEGVASRRKSRAKRLLPFESDRDTGALPASIEITRETSCASRYAASGRK
jgi:hypothetical protein